MESNNTFQGGMESDSSKLFQNENTYLRATNLRPVTELGSSNNALVNIKGNQCAVTFPPLKGVYKLQINKLYEDTFFLNGTITITINGITSGNIVITASTQPLDIYNTIIGMSNCIKNPSAVSPTFDVAYNEDYIFIYQIPEYSTCSPSTPTEPSISIDLIEGSSTLEFINTLGVATPFYGPYIPAITTKLVIIGSTFIGEDIFLFTCPINSNGTGQIWKLTYDEITLVTTLTLLYNNYLNFSKEYPIPPSAAIGRYEIGDIQRIYWTDFNNAVRSVNTADPNLMALSVVLINLTSSIDMNIPVLSNIIQGGVATGNGLATAATWQCAYRLVKNNGAVSNYSPCSNMVYLVPEDIPQFIDDGNVSFCSLAADPTVYVNKAIEWEVDGIDTNYDTIEFVVISRYLPNPDTFAIYKFDTQVINGQTKLTTIYRNDPLINVPITNAEFLLENSAFTHAKTLEQKDNRLFFANVKNDLSNYLDTFDTRAFRFDVSTNNIAIKKFENDPTVTVETITVDADYANIPETSDAIPVYNLGLSTGDNADYNSTVKYQRNSTIIGGTGPNISYKFGSRLIRSDAANNDPNQESLSSVNQGTDRDLITSLQAYKNGYRRPALMVPGTGMNPFNNSAPFQTYRQNDIRMSMGLEYLSGNFKSYQHNEIYRFGILFYSKTAGTNFVKWIGDIKFPNYSHPVAPGLEGQADGGGLCTDHRSMFVEYTGHAYCNLPYIDFTVNIPPALEELIDGYEIVRVKREVKDRVIPTTGLINQVQHGADGTDLFLPVSHFVSPGGTQAMDPASSPSSTYSTAPKNVITFHSYDYLCDGNVNGISIDDKLIISEKYSLTLNTASNPGSGAISGGVGYEQFYYISKYYALTDYIYENNTFPAQELKIKESYYITQDADSPTLAATGNIYHNRDWYNASGTPIPPYVDNAYSQGCPTVLLGLDNVSTPMIFQNYNNGGNNVTNGNSKLLTMHYKPSRLSTQYGGRSYLNRANNEYISTGAFYSVRNPANTSIKVFGGDIYHGIIDIQKAIKNWAGVKASAPTKHSQTWYYPTQSVYNVDLRKGIHVNADLNNDGGTDASAFDEYTNIDSYNYENTLKKHYPKPIFFNQTDIWNNRVYWSEVKINGENQDSWSNIPVNNYYDVEGNYGGINALVTLRNNMYFLQDRALGLLQINPQSLVTDQNNQTVKLGNGDTLSKHLYMSIDAGTKYQWSVYRSNSHITFVDGRHKKIFLFDGQQLNPISDTKNNRNFLQKVFHDDILINDNPIIGNGVLTTYDYKNNEFLYTFLNDFGDREDPSYEKYTLVFSDLTQRFTSFYNFTPYIYVNNHNKLYSPRDYSNSIDSKLYLHNVGNYCLFYDILFPSTLKALVNTNPKHTKIFDNLSWVTESIQDNNTYIDGINNYLGDSDDISFLNDTWNRIRCYTEYQNTDWQILQINYPVTNLRKSEQGYTMQVYRNKVNWDTTPTDTKTIFDPTILTKTSFGDRLRDKYMIVDLEYNNSFNNRFITHNLSGNFRISDR